MEKNDVLKAFLSYQASYNAEQSIAKDNGRAILDLAGYCFQNPVVCQKTYENVSALSEATGLASSLGPKDK